jgi:hypothetical protein
MRMSWARLLKRVFDIDIERCPQCGAWNFIRWLDTRAKLQGKPRGVSEFSRG